MNTKQIIENLINDFDSELIIHLLREKTRTVRRIENPLPQYNDENFSACLHSGEFTLENQDKMIVVTVKVNKDLSERSGKKAQYTLGKKILKDFNSYIGGFFIFYDSKNDFRFSLIYDIPLATGKRDWSNFRRYTYFVSKEQTNKTFINQFTEAEFSSIEKIIDAFSVEKVTKEFYTEIANWYFWALKKVKFPDDAEAEKNGREIAVIRLITRLIFIWFMKVKKLVPEELFNENSLKNILTDLKSNNDNYYKAILQNLFFATLNTKPEERRFTSKKKGYRGFSQDFGNHNVYRYEDSFKDSEEAIEKYFMPIPFLNGGLFECLDYKSKIKDERKYIDGFTSTKSQQPSVPNYLFFNDDIEIDLNKDYGTTNKKYNVRGLIKTLSLYNFTIDESDPNDADVALDPELLGKVFENLLASYNPETAKTARKSTGSYYTPRSIVDYMVDESLKQYFKTHIQTDDIDNKLKILFSNEDHNNLFDSELTNKFVNLIDSLRVVDPAVGSGAFPMRILKRLVFLLHKLDPDNSIWKQTQIDGIKKSVKDPILQRKLIEEIERKFKEKNPDYGRKLYLIEKCIYGVDIQQIAVEIAKLRFFISLLVDEKVDNSEIEPLPNLDFKLMQGDSLISSFAGIDFNTKPKKDDNLFNFDEKYKQLIDEFEELKSQYQNEPDVHKKRKLRDQIDAKLLEIFEEKLKQHYPQLKDLDSKYAGRKEIIEAEKKKLFKKIGIDLDQAEQDLIAYTEGRKQKDFFLWDVYFAEVFTEKGGFDIVIGNPPYISTKGVAEKDKKELETQYGFSDDTYNHFFFKGIKLLKNEGILTYISSKTFWTIQTKKNLRQLLLNNTILQIFDTANPFESAMVDTCVSIIQKKTFSQSHQIIFLDGKKDLRHPEKYEFQQSIYNNAPNQVFFIPTEYNKKKYERFGKKINELLTKWWDKISTSKNIEKYKKELEAYRNSLKPGDITLLGLITEGGQGLATANNGKYIGVLEGTKWADNVRKQRPEKLLLANKFCEKQDIHNKQQAQEYLESLTEHEIRQLFDVLKERYGRDIFGQGWLYRIVSPSEIADVEKLTDDEKLNGIAGKITFVPYDKGDKEGNRWYAPTPYYIDWSRENVKFLKENSGKKGEGMPVVRNPQFYFREGFCWNNVLSDDKIKSRLKEKSIHSTEAMTFISCNSKLLPDYYLICLLNSKLLGSYRIDFINVSHHLTTGDAKEFPIIIPDNEQLYLFKNVFNRAYQTQKEKFEGKLSEKDAEAKLNEIQKELDEIVEKMYLG